MILSLEQTAFKENHSKSEDVIFEGVFINNWLLRFDGFSLFWRKVDVFEGSIVKDALKIGLQAHSHGIGDFYVAFIHQNDFRGKALMSNIFFLKGS